MKFKKIVTVATMVGLLAISKQTAQAVALLKDVRPAIEEQEFFFCDYDVTGILNTNRDDPKFGDEQRLLYLTDVETGERITRVRVGEEYIMHFIVVNDGTPNDGIENVQIGVGQGEDFYTISLNATINFGDLDDGTHGFVEFFSEYPVIDRTDDTWIRLKPVGKAKLYNKGGLLNGAQVNHKRLFDREILIGYDDQDGFLPYGREYACELRVRVRLESINESCHCWSDPVFEGRYTGKTIDEKGNIVDYEPTATDSY